MSDDAYFELPAHEVFGPQCVHVAALIERARHLTLDEASALGAARGAAWGAACNAGLDGELDAAWDAARGAAEDAARALVVRDLITAEVYDTLTRPWRTTIGPIHPDDTDLRQP